MDVDSQIRGLGGEPLRCPTDGSRLVELERSGTLIDACPQCRGVWLDRGELDKLLDRERRGGRDDDEAFFREMGGERERPRQPERPHQEDDYRKKRKRRSLLQDLF